MEKVLSTIKLEMDDDFNIIDPRQEVRKAEAINKINNQIESLLSRKTWLMEYVYDINQEVDELRETLKGYGVVYEK